MKWNLGPLSTLSLNCFLRSSTKLTLMLQWLGIPPLPLSTLISFAWGQSDARGTIGAVISTRLDERVGQLIWTYRNIPQSMTDWMAQNNVQFNANIQEYDLGCNDSWMLLMGTGGAYDMDDYVEAQLKSHGNVIHSVCLPPHFTSSLLPYQWASRAYFIFLVLVPLVPIRPSHRGLF